MEIPNAFEKNFSHLSQSARKANLSRRDSSSLSGLLRIRGALSKGGRQKTATGGSLGGRRPIRRTSSRLSQRADQSRAFAPGSGAPSPILERYRTRDPRRQRALLLARIGPAPKRSARARLTPGAASGAPKRLRGVCDY